MRCRDRYTGGNKAAGSSDGLCLDDTPSGTFDDAGIQPDAGPDATPDSGVDSAAPDSAPADAAADASTQG